MKCHFETANKSAQHVIMNLCCQHAHAICMENTFSYGGKPLRQSLGGCFPFMRFNLARIFIISLGLQDQQPAADLQSSKPAVFQTCSLVG